MALVIPQDLIAAVRERRAVLFLGAGASRGATHPSGSEMPTAKGLADMLSAEFLNSEYQGHDLRIVYDFACSQRDVRTVQRRMFEILNPFQPANFHLLVPTFAWAGMATTNYDLLMERAYELASVPIQKLVPNVKDGDGATDQLGDRSLLYVKLHGCISRHQDVKPPLLTSTEQLIACRDGRNGQFDTFLEWAKTKTIIFNGYSFMDSNMRILLDEVLNEGDNRPTHYIMNYGLGAAEVKYWSDRRVNAIDCTFQGFIEELDRQISRNQRILGVAAAKSENITSFTKFITVSSTGESEQLRQYLRSYVEHVGTELDPQKADPKLFYSGFDLGWYPISAELDVRQPIVDEILSEHIAIFLNHGRQSLVIIKGHAGSGKSVVLRRLCWEAAKAYDRLCFFVSRQHLIQTDRFKEIFQLTNLPILLFVDNAADHRQEIFDLIVLARTRRVELKIIGTETFPIWNATCDDLEPLVSQTYEMRYLSERNIRVLVDKLEKHNCLGYLASISSEQRIHKLQHVHGRQLLVALLEATHGTALIDIIAEEYKSIPSAQARLLYLDICSLHRFGPPVRAGLISRIHDLSFDQFREKLFKPLEAIVVLRIDKRSGDYVYEARHSLIAHEVYEAAINSTDERFDNIVRVLSKLNPNYSYDLDVISKIVRADNLEHELSDPAKIRQVYDVAEGALGERAFLFHQRGIFEMRAASNLSALEVSERFLLMAGDLEPFNRSFKHSLAEIDLRRSRVANDPRQRRAWRRSAMDRAAVLISKGNSPYPYHTLLKAAIDEVRDALGLAESDQSEAATRALGTSIENAEDILKRGLQAFPNEAILLSEEGELSNILSEAVRAEKAFQRAFAMNPRSTLIAKRLSRVKLAKGAYLEARDVLQKSLEHNPGAHDVHYDLAMVILKSQPDADQTESTSIIHHLGRSFTSGDKNRQARFWYARQLALSGRYEDARKIFAALSDLAIPFKEKTQVREHVLQSDGSRREYTGFVAQLKHSYGFVKCEALDFDVFFSQVDLEAEIADFLAVGDTVRFQLGFSLRGPVAVAIQIG